MCDRYERRSDTQRIAEMFQVSFGLEELYLAPKILSTNQENLQFICFGFYRTKN